MHISKQQFRKLIEGFQFRELFNQLGWNNIKETLPVLANEATFELVSVADKNGFRILVCSPGEGGNIPSHDVRFKLDKIISRLYKEHLIIFTDKKQTKQTWQLLWSSPGKPAKIHPTEWHKGQDPQILYQKTSGLLFTLDEEEGITIVDVTQRVANSFHQNNEKVTRNFYERFKKEHTSFLSFIKGIGTTINRDWYGSLMLNRLMFCYFIQKKGFLDNDMHYLRERLKQCKKKKGDGKFYSFYRSFLLILFHKGLNEPEQKAAIKTEIGKVPYLNGGLFDEHELERNYTDIDIDDKAFERIFDFFDEYDWHLDTRMAATGRDINPDVIGYIFEKYINDRAQMGAYYTKEDITDYISKNCIIPWLFDETGRHYQKAFMPNGQIWTALKESSSDYIYDAVKHGVDEPLPSTIQAGIKEVSKRTEWNKPASATTALPTEIWREVIERRNHCTEIKEKIDGGYITHINDFITYNLNIRQFAQDVVAQTTDPQFLVQFYKTLSKITILDPTCGSGAFLFAAMNILEPLYDACLVRMEAFLAENGKGEHNFFEEVLRNLNAPEHPNRQYFIYKSIILNNLYGVDIMREAVEIAKLRLFLKLVATVDADYTKPNLGLEPLPDIDFNIRAGNTLIGFASKKDVEYASRYLIDGAEMIAPIEIKSEKIAETFTRFKELQLTYGNDYKEFKKAKESLNNRLRELNGDLNKLLHKQSVSFKYEDWLKTHQPFHWFAEFYEIIQERKGFDVIIGNPPYIELKDIKSYTLKNYKTSPCGNLYANCYERGIEISNTLGRIGFIIPVASVCTDGYSTLQKIWIDNGNLFISSYNDRPGKLFEGLEHIRLAVVLLQIQKQSLENRIFSTKYYRWQTVARPELFYLINYKEVGALKEKTLIPKLNNVESFEVLKKITTNKKRISHYLVKSSDHLVYFTRKLSGFVQILNFIPKIYDATNNLRPPSELKQLAFLKKEQSKIFLALFNSSLFYWYLTIWSDCRNLNLREIQNVNFDFNILDIRINSRLVKLSEELMFDIERKSVMQSMSFKSVGMLQIQCIYPKYSKSIIDQIDKVLAEHYNFSDEELDFIINYDIKFRMGKEVDEVDTDTSKSQKGKTYDSNLVGLQTKLEPMKEFTVHEGIYFISDVARYTKHSADKIRIWFKELVKEDYEGLSGKEQSDVDMLRISFHGLVELVVIGALRNIGFTPKKIMKARADLKAKTGKIYPFATNDIKNLKPIIDEKKPSNSILTFDFSTGNISLDGLGQYNLGFISEFFSHIEFDTHGIAQRIFPVKNSTLIIIDRNQEGGRATINGKGVEAQVISMMYNGEGSMQGIKNQYNLTEEEILTAVDYWKQN